jgi:hypothetical protein
MFAPFECPDGETWVTPVSRAEVLTTRHDGGGGPFHFGEELANAGYMLTYDDLLKRLAEEPTFVAPIYGAETGRVRAAMRKPPPDDPRKMRLKYLFLQAPRTPGQASRDRG